MLAKKYKLPIRSVLEKRGRFLKGRCFLLKVYPNNFPFNRFGVIISKKIAKKSSERNRIKRLFFDIFKDFLFKQGEKNDFLAIIKLGNAEIKKQEIKKELKILCSTIFSTSRF